jgi:uncharacterized protein (DUF952 family)
MIYHIAAMSDWAQRSGRYAPSGWEAEGFIHCSNESQVPVVAGARFAGRTDLVVLHVEESLLDAPLVWEDSSEAGQDFPHIYGEIPVAAIARVQAFPCDAAGSFSEWDPTV